MKSSLTIVPDLHNVILVRRAAAQSEREARAERERVESAALMEKVKRVKAMFVPYMVETEGVAVDPDHVMVGFVRSENGNDYFNVYYDYEETNGDGVREVSLTLYFQAHILVQTTGCRVCNIPAAGRWSDSLDAKMAVNAVSWQTLADAIFVLTEPVEV